MENNCYMIFNYNRLTDVGNDFVQLTEYSKDELAHKGVSEVFFDLLRLSQATFDQINIEGHVECFIFTKSLEVRDVRIHLIRELDCGRETYYIKENLRLEKKMIFLSKIMKDEKVGVGIYSVPDFILLKANSKYLNYISEAINHGKKNTIEFDYKSIRNNLGHCINDLISNWNGRVQSVWGKLAESEETLYITEKKGLLGDCDDRYWDNTLTPITENDKIKYIVSNLEDVTEKVNNKKKVDEYYSTIEKQALRLKMITENMNDALFIINKDGTYDYFNERAGKMIQGPENIKKIGDSRISSKYYDESGEELTKDKMPSSRVVNGEKIQNVVIQAERSGTNSYLNCNGGPIYDANGELTSAILCFRDVTDYINTQKVLLEAKEAAEVANKAKSQFLANMSHEIRTPMNGFIGMIELVLMSNLTDQQKEFLNMSKLSATSLLRIINDILDLSKIEVGKSELKYEYVDVKSLIDMNEKVYTPLINNKRLNFRIKVDEDVPKKVYIDVTRLNQVISNLIGNSIKFTLNGQIELYVQRTKVVEDKVQLIFSIRDTGIGIREEDIPKLFNYFTQLDDSRTKQFKGTGLGLAISKKLVELMGGEIGVESEFGKGSNFYFTIWVDVENKEKEIQNLQVVSTLEQSKTNINILLVEDDYVSQLIIKGICEILKWNINIASNGREALKILENTAFNIILMDIQMPEMSGIEVTNLIRQKEKLTGEHIPIIATTAYAMSQDSEYFINSGMDDYISKPIDLPELKEVIEKWVK